ncbi:C4 protein [Tomato leaf curl Mahe virus]|uniref:C4 protein n=1 Tax=Tomato leaf curl Mahe virus TaxID=2303151 RepID=A0A346FY75_9GEMI|nr:C4 protein [Tomato leaf curl Mahe virus]AXN77429.1 C4 protein [Tomato leaf curl Mahe virus]AXN77434.1 C4 protein [Tomato leaf curl Mahe virus]AXN77441.1 C4 protein [Tomato leaf curl Mahe virus]AXN77447.1 C4 protein [Tomato leaf curl Mahe virus]AXN77453.1 C4 protein [Tomato leaf curl Mahe virus]
MGCLISMFSSNSKASSNVQTRDSSISFPLPDQHISIRTFRELNHRPMSKPTLKREGNFLTMEFSRSMPEVQGGRASI